MARYCIPVMAPDAGVFVPPVEFTSVTVMTSFADTVAPIIGKPEFVVAPAPALVDVTNTLSPTFTPGAEHERAAFVKVPMLAAPVRLHVPSVT